ncbi:hypothetical protein MSAN_00298600 [Mycena sanguinolenta]|uniref:Uncharacterized protein n=1 Tax=Mycena sanguinolenta TaxID=230812 RepID=A0A8H6Z8B4_9AGAR|nr:hypothetical protein MSAN_00298600 [Mycena sanguinolenta]
MLFSPPQQVITIDRVSPLHLGQFSMQHGQPLPPIGPADLPAVKSRVHTTLVPVLTAVFHPNPLDGWRLRGVSMYVIQAIFVLPHCLHRRRRSSPCTWMCLGWSLTGDRGEPVPPAGGGEHASGHRMEAGAVDSQIRAYAKPPLQTGLKVALQNPRVGAQRSRRRAFPCTPRAMVDLLRRRCVVACAYTLARPRLCVASIVLTLHNLCKYTARLCEFLGSGIVRMDDSIFSGRVARAPEQVYGNIHAAIFHDDLIPYQQFLELYKHSHFSTVYIYAYVDIEFEAVWDYFWTTFEYNLDLSYADCTFFIRRSTGRFCADLVPGGADPLYYAYGSNEMSTQQGLKFLAGENSVATIIDSLCPDQYHSVMCYQELSVAHSISISISATINMSGVFRDALEDTEFDVAQIAYLPYPELELASWCISGQWLNFGKVMADRWIR